MFSEITNFTKELQVLTEDMMNYLKKSGDAVRKHSSLFTGTLYFLLEIRLPQNLAKVDLVICDLCVISNFPRMVFHIRDKIKTHCASYTAYFAADRNDKLENGCEFSVYSKLKE